MKITVTHDDGTTADITEAVRVTYDIAYGSMNWGSGFLDLEEMEAVARLAETCRFPSFEAVLAEVHNVRLAEERKQEARDRAEKARREQLGPLAHISARDGIALVQATERIRREREATQIKWFPIE